MSKPNESKYSMNIIRFQYFHEFGREVDFLLSLKFKALLSFSIIRNIVNE
jgi:hypothetical protein